MATYNIIAVFNTISGTKYYYNFGQVKSQAKPAAACKQYARKYADSITAELLEPGYILWGAMDPETGKLIDGIKQQINPFLSGCMYVGFKPEKLPTKQVYNK